MDENSFPLKNYKEVTIRSIRDMNEPIKEVVLMKLSRVVKEKLEWLSIIPLKIYG